VLHTSVFYGQCLEVCYHRSVQTLPFERAPLLHGICRRNMHMQVQYTTCSYAVEYTLCFADGILVGAVTHISENTNLSLSISYFLGRKLHKAYRHVCKVLKCVTSFIRTITCSTTSLENMTKNRMNTFQYAHKILIK